MRLICTITDLARENPLAFSYYLRGQGIENTCEEGLEKGKEQFRIWVHDEDHVERAQALYREYQINPHDPKYRAHYEAPPAIEESTPELESEEIPVDEPDAPRRKRRGILSPAPYGPVSIFILFAVVALFIWAQVQRGNNLAPPQIPGVIQAATLAPVETALIYDYPTYFELRDRLLKIYTPEEIEQQNPPSSEARKLMQEMRQTPVWMGIYDRFIAHYKNSNFLLGYQGPMFEKIAQGQVWRLFTPALLHFDLLHIFFNVLWFILLGPQIEFRLGWFKYLILILATAIVSNTAQYLMSGPFFMGLSGVVVGMAAFIWARQQVAPWEGYLLQRFTLIFLAIFVVGMFVLQLAFFFMQIWGSFSASITIANTAHIAGGVVGYLLGRLRFFAIQHNLRY
ncbi:rhomboid family intramembrane serine protease [Chlamydiota bacterium]